MIDLMPDKPKKGRKRTSKGAMVPGKEFRTMSQTPSLASSSPVKKKRKCRFLKSKPSEKQNVSLTSVNLETEMSEDGTSTEAKSLPEVGNEKETGPQKLRIVQVGLLKFVLSNRVVQKIAKCICPKMISLEK